MKLNQRNGRKYQLISFETVEQSGTYALLKDLNLDEIEPYLVVADLEMDEGKVSWSWGNYYTNLESAEDKYHNKT